MLKLVICDDEGKITVVPFVRDEVSIGRKEGNTIRLTDRNVSRQHARIYRDSQGRYFVANLTRGATVKVENREVGTQPEPLKLGEQVYIGDYKLSLRPGSMPDATMGEQAKANETPGVGEVKPFARLVMLKGPLPGREYDMTANLYVIGRSSEANLNIDDASISRAHARLDADDNRWTISDLDSINGIKVNGTKKDDYLLKSGDIIELGTVRFRYVAAGEPYFYSAFSSIVPPPPSRNPLLNIRVLAIVSVLLFMLVIWIALRAGMFATEPNEVLVAEDNTAVAQGMVLQGKQAMELQKWEDAARLFAEAQMRNPEDLSARELKKKANLEMIAQAALAAYQSAEKESQWQVAMDELVKIPKDSYYFDQFRMTEAADKLCEDLLYKADFMITAGDPKARTMLDQLGMVPGISDRCRAERTRLLGVLSESGN